MGNIIELKGRGAKPKGAIPLSILDRDYENHLRFDRGIEVPQTPFDHWGNIKTIADVSLYQWSGHSHLTIGTVTHQEQRDMERILELAENHRSDDYGRCRLALVEWLRQEGVKVGEIVFSGGISDKRRLI